MHSEPHISGNGVIGIFKHTLPHLLLMDVRATELPGSEYLATARNYLAVLGISCYYGIKMLNIVPTESELRP
jgi:hypothetical protein